MILSQHYPGMLSSSHCRDLLAFYVIPNSAIARNLLPRQTFQFPLVFPKDKREFQEKKYGQLFRDILSHNMAKQEMWVG